MSVKIRKTLEDDVYRASGQSGAASSRQGPTVLGDRGGNDRQGQTRSAEKEGKETASRVAGATVVPDTREGDGKGPRSLAKKRGKERDVASRCDRSRTIVSFSLPESFLQMVSFLPESRLAFSVEFKGRASQYFGKFFKWTIRESKIGNGVGAAVKGRTRLDIRQIKPASLERPATAAYPEN
ncbi:hypothetical protein HZH68_015306 [Vespula germanica]|uniref:Uncharacterized protein n=1 Tax=Vespula germanica TaxID=30212 RepID=A0A834J6J6_VESGE|nr:hypothetical protein HZH68_015306 [Vespula germanica]